MTAIDDSTALTDDIAIWPKDMGSDIRLLKIRLSILETEFRESYRVLAERMDELEEEISGIVNE